MHLNVLKFLLILINLTPTLSGLDMIWAQQHVKTSRSAFDINFLDAKDFFFQKFWFQKRV